MFRVVAKNGGRDIGTCFFERGVNITNGAQRRDFRFSRRRYPTLNIET